MTEGYSVSTGVMKVVLPFKGSLYHVSYRTWFAVAGLLSIFGSFAFFGPWTITPMGCKFNIDRGFWA